MPNRPSLPVCGFAIFPTCRHAKYTQRKKKCKTELFVFLFYIKVLEDYVFLALQVHVMLIGKNNRNCFFLVLHFFTLFFSVHIVLIIIFVRFFIFTVDQPCRLILTHALRYAPYSLRRRPFLGSRELVVPV